MTSIRQSKLRVLLVTLIVSAMLILGQVISLVLSSASFAGEAPRTPSASPFQSPPITQEITPSGEVILTPLLYVEGEVLVRFKDRTPQRSMASAHGMVRAARIREFGIVRNLYHVRLPHDVSVQRAIDTYRADPDVLYAEPNYIVEALAMPNDPSFGFLWGLHNIGQNGGTSDADIDAPEAWDTSAGSSSIVVAVIDTGVDYTHEDLAANMWRNSADCNNNGIDDDGNGQVDDCHGIDTINNDSNPMDDFNHGTHVSGIIGAVGNNGVGVAGVDWNVSIMACKFLNANGLGTTSGAVTCLEYVQLMKDRGVNIVATNNSWGGGSFSEALYDAIEAQRQSGILFIAAAGNFASNNDLGPIYPASYYLPNIVSVAATDRFDSLASFSNYGKHSVHLGAPGLHILSTTIGNNYSIFSGTSMAAPHVTGVAALLKAQNPARDWRAIKNLLLAGGDDNASLANSITRKRLNAQKSLTCSNSTVHSRLLPRVDIISGEIGEPIDLSALHVNCATPGGEVSVVEEPGGHIVTLLDDGIGPDQGAGDGIYSVEWAPPTGGTFTLTFPDGDVVTVIVHNQSPIANAGPDQTVILGTMVTLDGSGSADPDGNPLGFHWTQTGGPPVTLTGATTAKPTFTPATLGTFSFKLTVDDGVGGISSDTVVVTVATVVCAVGADIQAIIDDPATPSDALTWLQKALDTVNIACAMLNNPNFIGAFKEIKKAVASLERAATKGASVNSIIETLVTFVRDTTQSKIVEAVAKVCVTEKNVQKAQSSFDQGLGESKASKAVSLFTKAFKSAEKGIATLLNLTGDWVGTLKARQNGGSAKLQVTASLAQSNTTLTGSFQDSSGRSGSIVGTICGRVTEVLELNFAEGSATGSGKADRNSSKISVNFSGTDLNGPFTAKGKIVRQ